MENIEPIDLYYYMCSNCQNSLFTHNNISITFQSHLNEINDYYLVMNDKELEQAFDYELKVIMLYHIELINYCSGVNIKCKKCQIKVGILIIATTSEATILRDHILVYKRLVRVERIGVDEKYNAERHLAINGDSKKKQKASKGLKQIAKISKCHLDKNLNENILISSSKNLEQSLVELKTMISRYTKKYDLIHNFLLKLMEREAILDSHLMNIQKILFSIVSTILIQRKKKLYDKSGSIKRNNQKQIEFEEDVENALSSSSSPLLMSQSQYSSSIEEIIVEHIQKEESFSELSPIINGSDNEYCRSRSNLENNHAAVTVKEEVEVLEVEKDEEEEVIEMEEKEPRRRRKKVNNANNYNEHSANDHRNIPQTRKRKYSKMSKDLVNLPKNHSKTNVNKKIKIHGSRKQ